MLADAGMTEDHSQGPSAAQPPLDQAPQANFVSPKTVAIYGVLTALTAAITIITVIPFPPTKGYFNLGEAMVFFSALIFGWRAGAICGGVGSAIADVIIGYGYFAPITLTAKGVEGLVTGAIARLNGGKKWSSVLGIFCGGSCMVSIYFLAEVIILDTGIGYALSEMLTVNIPQVAIGGTLGFVLAHYVRKSIRLPK